MRVRRVVRWVVISASVTLLLIPVSWLMMSRTNIPWFLLKHPSFVWKQPTDTILYVKGEITSLLDRPISGLGMTYLGKATTPPQKDIIHTMDEIRKASDIYLTVTPQQLRNKGRVSFENEAFFEAKSPCEETDCSCEYKIEFNEGATELKSVNCRNQRTHSFRSYYFHANHLVHFCGSAEHSKRQITAFFDESGRPLQLTLPGESASTLTIVTFNRWGCIRHQRLYHFDESAYKINL